MRIAFVSLFTPEHGATPARARTRRVARGLADRGHDVVWLCARWWGGDAERFESDGVTYRAVVADPSPVAFATRLPASIRRVDPDVVHAVNSPPTPALAATFARRLRGPPVLVDWWRDHPRTPTGGIDCSRAMPTRSRRRHGRRRRESASTARRAMRSRVVPESIDTGLIADAAVDDRFDAVYSRRLDRHANVETFLLALAEIRGRDWTAAVIGDGPERERIESTARDLRIADRVEFLGALPLEERVSICKGTHVFAQTATWETFASELLLGLACGCVGLVEYQAESSAHELVEGRTRGRLVTSPEELADELVAVGDLDRRTTEPAFDSSDHDAVLDRYVDVYGELVAE